MSSTIFSLAGQSLKLTTAAETAPQLSPLTSNPHITEISLSGNTLGIGACEALASALSTKKSLQVANLADIFTSRLLSEIPPALSALLTSLLECPNLHTVDLSDNAFGLNTVAPLVSFLKAHVPLRHLRLNNNGLGPDAGTLIADALSELADRKEQARRAGKDVPHLETIVCGRNRLESGSMKAWARAFGKHRGVKEVRMVQNGIRQDGIVVLLREGLGGCEVLEVLDLEDNTFTITGAKALADVMGRWTRLRELGLGDCYLSARGGILVAEALEKGRPKKLEVLKLPYNNLDKNGVKAILAASKGGLEALRWVELNGNKFSEDDEGVDSLRELLNEREEAAKKKGEVDGMWGLDELDELDDESDEEGGDDDEEDEKKEEEEEREKRAEAVLKDADQEENANVSQKKDKDVDDLAKQLDKTAL